MLPEHRDLLNRLTGASTLGSAEAMTVPVYVRDICVRCGRTAERADGQERRA